MVSSTRDQRSFQVPGFCSSREFERGFCVLRISLPFPKTVRDVADSGARVPFYPDLPVPVGRVALAYFRRVTGIWWWLTPRRCRWASPYEKSRPCSILSGEKPIPGTNAAGLNAACSTSWK